METLKKVLNRKIVAVVLTPLVRRLGTALAVYLTARDVPADAVDQLLTASGVILGLGVDIILSKVHDQETAAAARRQALGQLGYKQDWQA